MTKRQLSQLRSSRAVVAILSKHSAQFAGIPAFVDLWQRARNKVDLVACIAGDQERSSKGISADKERIRRLVIDTGLVVAGLLRAWAGQTGNVIVESGASVTLSSWKRMPQIMLPAHIGNILKLAQEHREALRPYGLTDDLLQELEARIEMFDFLVLAPREAIVQRKVTTQILERELRGLMELFAKAFDPLMFRFVESAPEFYREYTLARRQHKLAATPIWVVRRRAAEKAVSAQARKEAREAKRAAKAEEAQVKKELRQRQLAEALAIRQRGVVADAGLPA
jgi:hypothetical protein